MVSQLGNIRAAAYELCVEHLFTQRAKVTVLCIGCNHMGKVDPFLFGRWGRHERLGSIERRLKCAQCGMLGFCHLRVEWIE
jgi:hypothetical protein